MAEQPLLPRATLYGPTGAPLTPRSLPAATRAPAEVATPRVGGRLTLDSGQDAYGIAQTVMSPTDSEGAWRSFRLDDDAIANLPPHRLMELLTDLSPDVSRALWDFLRLCNPGYEAVAYAPGGDAPAPVAR